MGFKWEYAWLSNGIRTYPTNSMLMLVMACSLLKEWYAWGIVGSVKLS